MSDHEEESDVNVLDDVAVNKHMMAAEIVNTILSELLKHSIPGANIIDLCKLGDKRIMEETAKLYKKDKNMKKGIAFPTTISVNNIICHFAPVDGDVGGPTVLQDSDVVKINVGAHIDGYAAVVGDTFVIGATQEKKVCGKKADVILAAHIASELAMRLLRPGGESTKFSELITKATGDFNCRPIEGVQSHQMRKMVYDADKSVMLNPNEEHKKTVESCSFEVNEVWNVDIAVSTGDGKPREHNARTTIYKKNDTMYQLKMKASRQICSEVENKFRCYPFNIGSLEDVMKARLGITECVKHDVLQAFPVYCEKDDEIVCQFRFTVLLMPNGPMRITGLPFDQSLYSSEFKVRDPDVKDLLSQPIKNRNKKKKTPKAVADSKDDK